jgi:ATP-dependent Zn protease
MFVCPGCAQEIDDSVDRIVAGMEGTPMVDGKSKSLVAYHEVRHVPSSVTDSSCRSVPRKS